MTSQQKKVVCLVIPSLQPGGMERVMAELANYFVSDQHLEVHLVLYGIKRDIFYTIDKRIIVHRPSFHFNNRMRLLYTLKTLLFLRYKFRELRPDSILSFGEVWNSFVLLANIGLPYSIYVSDRCQPDKKWSTLQRNLRRWLYPTATGLIAQTQKAREIYQRLLKDLNICVIGNPIRSITIDLDIPRENIILSVGRLIKSKHHDDLIKIFAELNRPNWKLVIVGDDAQKQQNKERLVKLIKELRIEDRVVLAGQRSDVDDFYRRSKIFAFASSSEGFPNVIGEAMSAQLPVVSFDCIAGPSELIQNGETGYLVPLFDSLDMKNKLLKLIEDPDLMQRMGVKGRNVISSNFSVDKISDQFLKFILVPK